MNAQDSTILDTDLFGQPSLNYRRPNGSLLKWIGSKYKMAEEICSYLPREFGTFHEVFLGGAAVLATVRPLKGVGSDVYGPLIEIWEAVRNNPSKVVDWYAERYAYYYAGDDHKSQYEKIKARFNREPNGPDFLFLCRSCYGGVIRFRKADGYMSTPCGVHKPLRVETFKKRTLEWSDRLRGCHFVKADFKEMMAAAKKGDVIYCDPPYVDSQTILYGAQDFLISDLMSAISECKERGVHVMLSIDGTKKSGNRVCDITIPEGLFETEIEINVGRSMLKRFQMNGKSLESDVVTDRLLLTYA